MSLLLLGVMGVTHAAEPQSPARQNSAQPAASQTLPALLTPVSVAYDSAGDLFFADARRNQVFELTPAGAWSVVAGTGEQGFAGDGGTATAALLDNPHGLAVGADGTLYIADTGNQRIRAVNNGIISTVVGSGKRGFSGDGSALGAALRDPSAVALDVARNLVVCDTGNQRVRRVSGGNIVTIAGTGEQGYSGEGGAAIAAQLDTPMGIAVQPDGTILIADTHNQRVRALSISGILTTLAGGGTKSFAGDGGPAASAALDLPFGVAVAKDGSVLIADAGNQRIRSVSPQGIITTVAGAAVQGAAADAVAGPAGMLNSPRAVSVQLQGQPVFADTRNAVVRELADNNALYTLALLAAPRVSTVALSTATSAVYGQGAVRVNVSGSAATPQGVITLLDNGSTLSTAQLAAGIASFSLGQLGVGGHTLTAQYGGDALNGSATSGAASLAVNAAPAVAIANPAMATYGAALPALSGTVNGILPQDAAAVQPIFATSAGVLSPVGSYPISARLSGQGSANYALIMGANSGSLLISQARSVATLSPVTSTYAGLPLLLSASIASSTSGAPSGAVDFLDGAAVVNSASVVNGTANGSLLSTSAGAHNFSVRYNGDANFLPSTSAVINVSVAAMPDFAVSLSASGQSVQGGSVATYPVSLAPQNGPFTGVVVFSVSGLPPGATASFSPASVVPGASAASVMLSVQTVARTGKLEAGPRMRVLVALGCFIFLCFPLRHGARRKLRALSVVLLLLSLPSLGCGTRTAGSAVSGSGQSYTLTVQGTATNLAGAVVVHAAAATLTVL